jgi:hypothetical protein
LSGVPAAQVGDVIERLVRAREAGQDLLAAALQIAAERDQASQAAAA